MPVCAHGHGGGIEIFDLVDGDGGAMRGVIAFDRKYPQMSIATEPKKVRNSLGFLHFVCAYITDKRTGLLE